MTELELTKYKYDLMRKCAIECQETIHFISNIHNKDRHVGKMQDCTEQTCSLFRKMLADIDRVDETYRKSFPDLIGKPSSEFQLGKKA